MHHLRWQRVLVFGGTFDPPHLAHVVLPRLAMEALAADAVVYVPAANPPHKVGQPRTDALHRLAMLRLALSGTPWAAVLTDELDRAAADPGRPSYTVETLTALHGRFGNKVEMRLLIGADQLRIFPQWRDSARIEALAEPAVMVRPPDTPPSLLASLRSETQRRRWAPRLLALPQFDLSASYVRRRAARGLPLVGLTPPGVVDYIRRHGLYRDRPA